MKVEEIIRLFCFHLFPVGFVAALNKRHRLLSRIRGLGDWDNGRIKYSYLFMVTGFHTIIKLQDHVPPQRRSASIA